MAARPETPVTEVVSLRHLGPGALDSILEDEVRAWQERLSWDFQPSAALVKRFADLQSLNGRALMIGGVPAGYTYTVADGDKGLVGDHYIHRDFATPALEDLLLAETVESLYRTGGVRRIESQIILLSHPRRSVPVHPADVHLFERYFMTCDARPFLAAPPPPASLELDSWHERYQDDAATLIAASYEGHVDSRINEQYQSPGGARRFLQNIVQYPGCGEFSVPASWLAWNPKTGRLSGISLASQVSAAAGHITQICVAPDARGGGIGRELLVRSLSSLSALGCEQVSLTVTASNRGAIRLYESLGFRVRHRFAAMVWGPVRPPRRFFS